MEITFKWYGLTHYDVWGCEGFRSMAGGWLLYINLGPLEVKVRRELW